MITLYLLHPIKQIPVQFWTFKNESTIRIGRSTDNQVILYSAVVSRHHVELRRSGNAWEVVNLGTNGTYLDGKRITQVPVADGAIIRLARSGPNLQIRIGEGAAKDFPKSAEEDKTISQGPDYPALTTEITDRKLPHGTVNIPEPKEEPPSTKGTIPVPPHLQLSLDERLGAPLLTTTLDATPLFSPSEQSCTHPRGGSLFCPDCGQPIQVLQTIGGYQLLKVLGQGEVGITYLARYQGQSVVLKTLNSHWADNPNAQAALECEADMLRSIRHHQIPHLIDFLSIANRPYMVMEWMAGSTLTEKVSNEAPVPISQAIAWMLELCKVLDYLHSFTPPLLHRGLKPTSLICQTSLDKPNGIALVDFGTIKAIVLGSDPATGYSAYHAPETLELEASPAVDLYSIGPLLAYLISGQNPIAFYSQQDGKSRFRAETVPGIPPDLIPILNTLTHPHPDSRYPSARIVAEVLSEVQNLKPIS